MLSMTSPTALHVVNVLLDVVVLLFSADVVVIDVVVEQFSSASFVEQFVVDDVVFDVFMPMVLLDVENDAVVYFLYAIRLMSDIVVELGCCPYYWCELRVK